MYDDSITTTGAQELLAARLAQAEASLRGTPVTTREDLLATVYSALNAVLSLGNNITPLFPVAREGPAIAGDLNDNFRILNQDAQAIIKQLLGTENDAATLFNLFASTQNNLRQTIREAVYTSGSRRYVEEFISNTKLGTCTATVDFNAGVVALPLVQETFVQPDSIDFGVACDGVLGDGTTDLLLDGLTETSMTWTGSRLELGLQLQHHPDPEPLPHRPGGISGPGCRGVLQLAGWRAARGPAGRSAAIEPEPGWLFRQIQWRLDRRLRPAALQPGTVDHF
jgi:hypothetical protein